MIIIIIIVMVIFINDVLRTDWSTKSWTQDHTYKSSEGSELCKLKTGAFSWKSHALTTKTRIQQPTV